MAKVDVVNMKGETVGDIELSDDIFGVDVNEHLIYLSVKQYLAANRQGTQKAKTRAEVSGGGRKPWRQKGTGHARQGSNRSPQWKGGGVVFARHRETIPSNSIKRKSVPLSKARLQARFRTVNSLCLTN